ncbi:hypothetical protein JXR93_09980 [bacterium]|nr:hypothetical protein [bacterium]
MRYLLFIITIMVTLFIGCGKDEKEPTTDLCKNKVCEEWAECNSTNGVCEAKAGFCSENGDCVGLNVYCDEATHTCIEENLCKDVVCADWEECNSTNGVCELKEGNCEENGDCVGLNQYCNLTTHICEEKLSVCDGISCGGTDAGSCGVVNENPVCVCNSGYFKKSEFECVEDNCANRSPIGHTKESATSFESSVFTVYEDTTAFVTEQDSCQGVEDIYLITDESVVIVFRTSDKYVKRFEVELYKDEIDLEHKVFYKNYVDHMNDVKTLIKNPERANYYLVIRNISSRVSEDYHLFYDEFCVICDGELDCIENICYDKCESDSECGLGFKCDETTNECSAITCTMDQECSIDDWYDFNYCINGKCVERVDCHADSDCSELNYDDVYFFCYHNKCKPSDIVNFGESITKEIYLKKLSHHFKIDSMGDIYNFEVKVKGLEILEKTSIEIIFYQYDNVYNYSCFGGKRDNSIAEFSCKIPPYQAGEPIFVSLLLDYENCLNNCDNVEVTIEFGENNPIGCSNDDVCILESEKENTYYTRSICDIERAVCVENQQENISELGESCDNDANCIEFDTICISVCMQEECISDEECLPLPDGSETYCDNENQFYIPLCRKFCQTDNDCIFFPNLYNSHCDEITNRCVYEELR